jgi:hypothetical protein
MSGNKYRSNLNQENKYGKYNIIKRLNNKQTSKKNILKLKNLEESRAS